MKIVVCVKQVPATSEIKINPETNTLERTGLPSRVNSYDEYAIEEALRTKEKVNGYITAISMGPPQAKEALRDCLAVGVDEAVSAGLERPGPFKAASPHPYPSSPGLKQHSDGGL